MAGIPGCGSRRRKKKAKPVRGRGLCRRQEGRKEKILGDHLSFLPVAKL